MTTPKMYVKIMEYSDGDVRNYKNIGEFYKSIQDSRIRVVLSLRWIYNWRSNSP